MSLGTRGQNLSSYLRELGSLYISQAIETFAEDFKSLKIDAQLRVSYNFVPDSRLNAACWTKTTDGTEDLVLEISEACLQRFAADIDVSNDVDAPIFEWRFCWLAFHEIAHWLYGHIPYYKQQGWIAELGLCETVSFSANSLAAGSTDKTSGPEIHLLAHAAELQADAFATVELFKLINQLPSDEDDKDEEFPLELDIKFCYFCIVSTMCSFYKDAGKAKSGQFHPSWNVRCLNVLLTLFRAYSHKRGVEGGSDLTYENRLIENIVAEFIDRAIVPAAEWIEVYAGSAGLAHLVHAREQEGLYDPHEFLRLLRGEFVDQSLACQLAEYLDVVDQLNLVTAPLRSARDFKPQSASVQRGQLQTHFRFQILCNLSQVEMESVIDEWRDQNGLCEIEKQFAPYAGPLDAEEVIDIRFRVSEPVAQHSAQALVRQLIDLSEKRAGDGWPRK